MRIAVVLALLLAACGSTLSNGVAKPSPSAAPVPWIAATGAPMPMPTATPTPRPVGIPSCPATDVIGMFTGGQGAGGWITRSFAIGNRGAAPCVVDGPMRATYVDAQGRPIIATAPEAAALNVRWAVLGPLSAPSTADDHRDGQAMIGLATYGDCGPAPAVASVTFTFAAPTGDVSIPMLPPSGVGGRCDVPGMTLMLGIFMPLAPAWWSTKPPEPTNAPSPLSFTIDAPSVAFAGETLVYLVNVRNSSPAPYEWGEACPSYLEWLSGREVTPTSVPGHVAKPADPVYAGLAKETHSLNCLAAGAIAPNGHVAFEIHLDLPRDAFGSEKVCWGLMSWPATQSCVSVQFLAPRP